MHSVPQLQERQGAPESTSQSTWETHHFAFSLFRSFWELLEQLVWLFRIAESLSYDFQTILHFADEGWFTWSTWSMHNLRFDRHFFRNSNANRTTSLDFWCRFHVSSRGCLQTNITPGPFRLKMSHLDASNMRFRLSFTSIYLAEQTDNIGLTYWTLWDRWNLLQPAPIPSMIRFE